jgi:hypothetical protein
VYPTRWTALKDALSDLWAFEIMYRGKLKNEFFQYWRTLTEGDAILSRLCHPDSLRDSCDMTTL